MIQGMASTCALPSLHISQAASFNRVIFDKLWHGANQAKTFEMDTPEWHEIRICKCCYTTSDSLTHLVLHCDHGDMTAARQPHIIQINTLVASLRGVDNAIHRLLVSFRERFLAQDTIDMRPAFGLWTQSLWDLFAAGKPHLARYSKSRSLLKKKYEELVKLCLRMAVEMAATKRRIEKHGADPFRHFRRARPPPEPPPSFRQPPPGTQDDVLT